MNSTKAIGQLFAVITKQRKIKVVDHVDKEIGIAVIMKFFSLKTNSEFSIFVAYWIYLSHLTVKIPFIGGEYLNHENTCRIISFGQIVLTNSTSWYSRYSQLQLDVFQPVPLFNSFSFNRNSSKLYFDYLMVIKEHKKRWHPQKKNESNLTNISNVL